MYLCRSFWLSCAILAFWLSFALNPAAAVSEYELKAAYLLKIINFIEWPEQALENKSNGFSVCIVGRDPFPKLLYAASGTIVKNKPLVFRHLQLSGELSECHIVFVTNDNSQVYIDILNRVMTSPIVTVSDDPKFIEMGGMISLVTRSGRINIEINSNAAKRASIILRAQLMEVAGRIIESERLD